MRSSLPDRLEQVTPTESEGFDRLPQILRVALKSFAEHGFSGVSMRDIGAGCGITAPALYRHVGGKADLLYRVVEDISANLYSGALERLEGHSDPRTRLDILIEWQVESAIDNPESIVVQDRDWSHLAPDAQKKVRSLQRAYLELWVTTLMAARPELEPLIARTIVQATIRMINSTPHTAHLDSDRLFETLSRMAVGALYS